MTEGMQIFDASGNIILDATYRVLRIIGSQIIGQSNPAGSVTDSRMNQGGWCSFQPAVMPGSGFLSGGMLTPTLSVSNGVLQWSYPTVNSAQFDTWVGGTLFYGAY